MKKITIQHIKNLKNLKTSFPTITAYDYMSAKIVDEAEIPLILVGDSASRWKWQWYWREKNSD